VYSYRYHNPTQVVFGPASFDKAAAVVADVGKTALVLTGRNHVHSSGLGERLTESLEKLGVAVRMAEGIAPNPTITSVIEMARRVRSDAPDVIVGFGGGSVMDCARLLSVALTHSGDLWEYRVRGSLSVAGIRGRTLPVVTIPTAAGTGGEISPAALATHQQLKEVFFSPHLFPYAAVVDPELALTLDPTLTAQVGIDAFVQSLEAFVSSAAQPFSDMFAIRSMQLAYTALLRLHDQPADLAARCDLALASMLSCYAIGQSSVGAVHALADPLSGRHNLGHGVALSVLLPPVMRANLESRRDRFALIPGLLDPDAVRGARSAEQAVILVEGFLERLGLSARLSMFGIEAGEFEVFAEEAQNPDMAGNPRVLSKKEIVAIYEQAA